MDFIRQYLSDAKAIIEQFNAGEIQSILSLLVSLKKRGGRLFVLGVGGSAANASHAVNDFRKITGIEAYAPTDNVSELTARTNDDGWHSVFSQWLKISRVNANDMLLIFSVGGGDVDNNVSPNLVSAIDYAKKMGASVAGIVGRNGGYTAQMSDACVIVPTISSDCITPFAESFQAVIWHLLVFHPQLKSAPSKWETVENAESIVTV